LGDPVLIPLIDARDEESRQQQLERLLVEHASPVIDSVAARISRSDRAITPDDIDDLVSTVRLRLVRKLQESETLDEEIIGDFGNYVARLTYNTIYDFLRERFPERTRLKNRIRYLLGHDHRLALWHTPEGMACGLAAWNERQDLLQSFAISRSMASRVMGDRERPHDAVAAMLQRAGRPLLLDTLVGIAADLWNITEARFEQPDHRLSETAPSHAVQYETRQLLEACWSEIRLLPQKQRAALLLNLRDPDGVNLIALLVLVRVAAFDEIAGAIGMSVEELTSTWELLPLDDLAIAERLQMTRQQVINLRRTARQRLARRTLLFRSNERRR
jgi:RNA polymerase sigma factor (sigma-70 family)